MHRTFSRCVCEHAPQQPPVLPPCGPIKPVSREHLGSPIQPVGGPRRPHRQITMKAQRFNLVFGRSLEDPLEVPWSPFEAPGRALEVSWMFLGVPWGSLGTPWRSLGASWRSGGSLGSPVGILGHPKHVEEKNNIQTLCYAMLCSLWIILWNFLWMFLWMFL
jgi:hypothetical protein